MKETLENTNTSTPKERRVGDIELLNTLDQLRDSAFIEIFLKQEDNKFNAIKAILLEEHEVCEELDRRGFTTDTEA